MSESEDRPPDVEGTAEEVMGTAVAVAEHHQSATLFRTDDPQLVVERASAVAGVLRRVLRDQKLTKGIQGKEHVLVEGWTTLGSMLGVVPVVTWTRKLENGWEARVEARTLDGRVVGASEAECLREESRWKNADDYAIRSMAQTRATSKALRGPLGFVVALAGYEATPSEEMPDSSSAASGRPHGPEAGEQLLGILATWARAHGTVDAIKTIKADAGGYLPDVVARALVRYANAIGAAPAADAEAPAPDPTHSEPMPPDAEVGTVDPATVVAIEDGIRRHGITKGRLRVLLHDVGVANSGAPELDLADALTSLTVDQAAALIDAVAAEPVVTEAELREREAGA